MIWSGGSVVGEAIVKDFRIFRDLNREIRSINLKIKQESVTKKETKSRPQQNFLRTVYDRLWSVTNQEDHNREPRYRTKMTPQILRTRQKTKTKKELTQVKLLNLRCYSVFCFYYFEISQLGENRKKRVDRWWRRNANWVCERERERE